MRSPANFDWNSQKSSNLLDTSERDEFEKENKGLNTKVKQKNAQIKVLSIQVTRMEMELMKVKQELGEALNTLFTNGLN